VIKLLHESLSKWGIAHPRIAVAGINPHAMFEEDKTHEVHRRRLDVEHILQLR